MMRRKAQYFYLSFVLLLSLSLDMVQSFFLPSNLRAASPFFFQTPPLRQEGVTGVSADNDDEQEKEKSTPHLIFPGGGIYFYWQAGVVTYLREQGYDLDASTFTGASAGALTATLSATNVDFYTATEKALALAADAGVWNRSGGLQGIWGPLIHSWLDDLLPSDSVERVNERLALLVTPVPLLGKEKITQFKDKEDLIRCNMASVHLPWFLDSKLTSSFRDRPYIDGSFLASADDYRSNHLWKPTKSLILDYNRDPVYQSQSWLDFVDAVSPDGIYRMIEDGKRFASQLEEQGKFALLPRKDA